MKACTIVVVSVFTFFSSSSAQITEPIRPFISVDTPITAISRVRVIDGTGAPVREDQTVILIDGKIAALGPAGKLKIPSKARVLEKPGYSLLPGYVGMHEHLYYTTSIQRDSAGAIRDRGALLRDIPVTGPRLYLAAGVTTARTAGCVDPFTDINVKKSVDAGKIPGPDFYLTAPYIEGPDAIYWNMHELNGVKEVRTFVNFWADMGFTSFKTYIHLSADQLKAAVEEAHKRKLKFTAHLCRVGYLQGIDAGLDNIEHGFFYDTDFIPGRDPNVCPPSRERISAMAKMDVNSDIVQQTFRKLIERRVAVTSTLTIIDSYKVPLRQEVLDSMSAESRASHLLSRAMVTNAEALQVALKKAMLLEREFVRRGGMLLAGSDPTSNGGILPGFGFQRELELLVEAGLTPLEVIKIATMNGAEFLDISDRVGSIAVGKQADLVLIKGDPSKNIVDIQNVETVFKAGIGYDSKTLIESVRGQVGTW
jgi:imidazolonepropionase-like amidohydrolase